MSVCIHFQGHVVAWFGLNMIGKIIPVASQFQFMILAINKIHCVAEVTKCVTSEDNIMLAIDAVIKGILQAVHY